MRERRTREAPPTQEEEAMTLAHFTDDFGNNLVWSIRMPLKEAGTMKRWRLNCVMVGLFVAFRLLGFKVKMKEDEL